MGAICSCHSKPVDYDGDVNLFHFRLLRPVGQGAFGRVRIVQHKQMKDLYALKYIEKTKCVKKKSVANVIQERRLLEEIDHPYIVNLRYAFQDDEHCFFVLDLMLGGDLRFHLQRLGRLSEEAVRFYVAQLSSALSYLHGMNIAHRDIKPDNILLDVNGNAHLTDFNIAVHFSETKLLTSVAGSMAYMAPEIFAKKGYTYTVDWWSLGVCAYELMYSRRPFKGKTNSDLRHAIMKDALKFPVDSDDKCSPEGRKALTAFMHRDPKKRLGCRPHVGFENICAHPWLQSIDWDTLDNKEQISPFVPPNNKANCDPTYELEEILLNDNVLKARERKLNQNDMSADMRVMEDQFTPYDFRQMRRRSYYPHNTELISTVTATDSTMVSPSRPGTPSGGLDMVANDDDQYSVAHGTDSYHHNATEGDAEKYSPS